MAVTTELSRMQEKCLQNCFEGKQFSLLYKASVHGFSGKYLLMRCQKQGPTITVIYSIDYVIVAYLQENYLRENKGSVEFLAFQRIETSGIEIRNVNTYTSSHIVLCKENDDNILYYGNYHLQIDLKKKNITVDPSMIEQIGLPKSCVSFQECEVFRCEDLLSKSKTEEITLLRNTLLYYMKTYNPYGNLVQQTRILLLGPTGVGKSSFIDSVKSVFRGRVTSHAVVGFDTKQFRTYDIKDGMEGNPLPFILCDSMGLGVKEEGLCMDDIAYILKGHIPDRYEFNSIKSITPSHLNYIDSPLLKDRIHCVAFVLDINSVEELSHEIMTKIKRIRRMLIKCGLLHVVLLTQVDALDLITKADLIDPYRSMPVKLKIEAAHRELGFPLSDIFVVSNYIEEWELDIVKDFLILSALRQMLLVADTFLEDLPPEETEIRREEKQNK